MRIAPNQHRLRMVALICWMLGIWWLLQPRILSVEGLPPVLAAVGLILSALLFALSTTFWLLANDRRAGVSLDAKGLSLNLGHSAAFVAWENVAAFGVTRRRSSLFALGSNCQLGIRLHHPDQYLQSYETRLPAASGPLAYGVWLLERVLRGEHRAVEPDLEQILALRRRTGYHIIIPETQLGGRAEAFASLLESYRANPGQRRLLPLGVVISRG
jgi:hypothetical protein